jgi:hypothetical protein
MSALTYRTPELPWSNNKQGELFRNILIVFLTATLVLGVVVPNISLPEIKREKLEKLPPQLAKVIKRKKEKPKPKPIVKPKVQEKKIEKKIEPKKDVVKPKPKVVKAKPKPKPKPKPKQVAKKKHTPEQRKAAKAKAKKLIANFADDLADMQSMVDMSTLGMDSSALNNAGMAATSVGSVIDQAAVSRVSGVDESQLTRATGAEQLAQANKTSTEVKALPKEALADTAAPDKKLAGMSRTQMQLRRVFERNQSRFDRIYRKALRSNPALEGTVMLGITIASNGEVSDCIVKSSDLQDSKVERRMVSTCKMLAFDEAVKEDTFEMPLTFAP